MWKQRHHPWLRRKATGGRAETPDTQVAKHGKILLNNNLQKTDADRHTRMKTHPDARE